MNAEYDADIYSECWQLARKQVLFMSSFLYSFIRESQPLCYELPALPFMP